MTKGLIDADAILNRAKPLVRQKAHEIQPFGHLVKLPIALAENVCKESVENLNQLLANTITLRDLDKKNHWQAAGPTFDSCICCSTSTMPVVWRSARNAAIQSEQALFGLHSVRRSELLSRQDRNFEAALVSRPCTTRHQSDCAAAPAVIAFTRLEQLRAQKNEFEQNVRDICGQGSRKRNFRNRR
jgi:hypothetical protein